MINTNKLKGRMREKEITQAQAASFLGIAQPTFNQKVNNIRTMDLNEAEKLCLLLDIEDNEFGRYFFAWFGCTTQRNQVSVKEEIMKSQKNLSESKVELLPERINDTSKLAEVIPDNITVSEIAKDRNGNPVFNPFG